jgi:hypothetical protein
MRVAGARVGRQPLGWKHTRSVPAPFGGSIGVFALQRIKQIHRAMPFVQVSLVQLLDALEMFLERRDEAIGQHRHAVLFALAVAHDDLMLGKIHVFDAQADALHESQAAAIQQFGHTCTCGAVQVSIGARPSCRRQRARSCLAS